MEKKIKAITEQLAKIEQSLSNPKELINYTCKMACNLGKTLDSGNFHQKQMFQKTLFLFGLGFDTKIDDYRTTEINTVFHHIADLSKGLAQKKPGFSKF